jgi:hypothetical protein
MRVDDAGVVILDTREIVKGPPKGVVTFSDPHPPDVGCI